MVATYSSALLKLTRANRHLQALKRAIQLFGNGKPYDLTPNVISDTDGSHFVINAHVLKIIPDSLGLIVGDICNNLHSVLDHLLWEISLDVNPGFSDRVYFPICDGFDWFIDSALENIGTLPDRKQQLIEDMQPYNRKNKSLSILRELNNADKHRDIPVVAAIGQVKLTSIKNLLVPAKSTMAIPTTTSTPIIDGAEVYRLKISQDSNFIRPTVNITFSFDLMIEEIPPNFTNLLVISTLTSMRDEVAFVLGQFKSMS